MQQERSSLRPAHRPTVRLQGAYAVQCIGGEGLIGSNSELQPSILRGENTWGDLSIRKNDDVANNDLGRHNGHEPSWFSQRLSSAKCNACWVAVSTP